MKGLQSYDAGVSPLRMLGDTMGRYFDRLSTEQPDHDAVVSTFQNLRYSYRQFIASADALAKGLLSQGIRPGDRVGLWSGNNAEWLLTQLAVAKCGAILVNINPGYRLGELQYVLNQSGVKLLVIVPKHRSSDYVEMVSSLVTPESGGKSLVPELEKVAVITTTGVDMPDRLPEPMVTYEQLVGFGQGIADEQLRKIGSAIQFDDPVNIQYTSGTTGKPKGVTLSHHNLMNNAWYTAEAMQLTNKSRFCVPMPFYHCGGMISSSLATLVAGGAVVIPGPFFEELPVLQAVQKERCTHLSGVPTMFIAELEHPQFKNYDMSSLQGGFMAGAPCPVKLMRRVADELHMNDVVILYGLTEVSPLMTCTTTGDSLELRATTVGRVLPGVELKIVDGDGKVVPRGSQGEVCCRGHGIMIGYWNNPQATSETIDQSGWLHSGDLGVMNEQGYINITGRKKDMIIRGGENVYPREVEEVLHSYPGISQAQVFGIPDEFLGEDIACWLMPVQGQAIDENELKSWMRDKLAHFKIPKHIKLVTEFPMTVTGKIQKFVMREQMVKELGLGKAAAVETA